MSEKTGVVTNVSKQGGRKRKLGPILVNFEHGQVDPEYFASLKAGLAYEFPDERLGQVPSSAEPNLKVFVKSDHLTYSNQTRSAKEVRPNPYTKTLLAIRNRTTNQVRLIETNMVTLAAEVRHPKTSNPFLIEEKLKTRSSGRTGDGANPDGRTTLKRHLVREFGQAKGKRIYEQAERMKVDTAQKHEKLLTVAENIDETAIHLPEQAKPTLLTPPCDRKAGRVEDVYKLSDIISDAELDVLEVAAKVLLESFSTAELIDEAAKTKKFTEIFAAILKRHLQLGNFRFAGAAIYVEAILQYLRLSPVMMSKGVKALPDYIPYAIRQKVFDTFVPNMVVSQENNDRALCYALVLTFILNNYCIEMKRLSASTKIRAQQLKKLIQATGAIIRTDQLSHQSFVMLKLPLAKFDPTLSLRKAKKKN